LRCLPTQLRHRFGRPRPAESDRLTADEHDLLPTLERPNLIAYKFWCWIGRLIPYERDLTFAKMTAPSDSLIGGGCSSDDIQKVLSTPSADLEAQQRAAREQQARYEALSNGGRQQAGL
jgi:hypothetical protein